MSYIGYLTNISMAGRHVVYAGLASLTLSIAVPVYAADDKNEAPREIEEITVTARYGKENAQRVPIGITTITGDQFDAQGTTSLSQVARQLPSLNLQGVSGRNQTFTIRGIGTNGGVQNDGLEQGVGLYIDGVYRPRSGAVLSDLLDIESIQLLRGPQGTLFGKNTVAGATDIRTREPQFTPEARAEHRLP